MTKVPVDVCKSEELVEAFIYKNQILRIAKLLPYLAAWADFEWCWAVSVFLESPVADDSHRGISIPVVRLSGWLETSLWQQKATQRIASSSRNVKVIAAGQLAVTKVSSISPMALATTRFRRTSL